MGEFRGFCDGEGLSLKRTMVLRFVLIVAIFIFHAGIHMGFVTPDVGYACVAVFFFLSGYGLELSLARKPGYMRNFLHRRVLGLMVRYWIVMALISLIVFLMHQSPQQLLNDFTEAFGVPLWYITELVAFYLVFYLTAVIADRRIAIAAMAAACVFVMLVLWYRFGTDLYFKSGICFVLGAAWYRCSGPMGRMMRGWFPLALILVLVPLLMVEARPLQVLTYGDAMEEFAATSLMGVVVCVTAAVLMSVNLRRGWFILLAALAASVALLQMSLDDPYLSVGPAMLLVISVSSVAAQVQLPASALAFLGAASLEFYLIHTKIVHYIFPVLVSSVLWSTLAAFVVSLVTALALHLLCERVIVPFNTMLYRPAEKEKHVKQQASELSDIPEPVVMSLDGFQYPDADDRP